MGIKEIFKKFRPKIAQEDDGLPDDMTRDRVLRSLRRERRIQLEENEKMRLRKKIAAFQKKKVAENLFGFKPKNKRKKNFTKKQTFLSRCKL